jgi:hypothetical protein
MCEREPDGGTAVSGLLCRMGPHLTARQQVRDMLSDADGVQHQPDAA